MEIQFDTTSYGQSAYKAYNDLLDQHLAVRVSDLKPGDVIWSTAQIGYDNDNNVHYPGDWRTIIHVESWDGHADGTMITIQFKSNKPSDELYWGTVTQQPNKVYFSRYNLTKINIVMKEIAHRFTGATLVYTKADKKNEETKGQMMEEQNTTTTTEQQSQDSTQNIPQRIANARTAGYSRKMIQDLSGVTQAQLARIEFKNSIRDHEVETLVPVLDSIENGTAEVQPRNAKKAESDDTTKQILSQVRTTLDFVRKDMKNTRKDDIVTAVRAALDLIDNA